MAKESEKQRIVVAGATGYIGRALVQVLAARGHQVVALARPPRDDASAARLDALTERLAPIEIRTCTFDRAVEIAETGMRGEAFDAAFSCIATRGGGVADAWAVERDANLAFLDAAKAAGVAQFVLLSAICVQKPKLAFQHAKLAFEDALRRSGLTWSIVRPTAYFKSLAGQIERVKNGKPFLVFGDGERTACKPISELDLADFLADCLHDPTRHDTILPIGGPGPAITPKAQGALLFELLGKPPRFKAVPLRFFDLIVGGLSLASKLFPRLADKTEFARIGRYYGTESMLVWDAENERYDADATPEFGTETLRDFYRRVLEEGLDGQELGEHAVFERKS